MKLSNIVNCKMGIQKINFSSFFERKNIAASIWFGLVAFALLNAVKGDAYNNFIIFKQSFFHLKKHLRFFQQKRIHSLKDCKQHP